MHYGEPIKPLVILPSDSIFSLAVVIKKSFLRIIRLSWLGEGRGTELTKVNVSVHFYNIDHRLNPFETRVS